MSCEGKDRVTIATELDHIVPLHKGGSDEPENWQGLCNECHRDKTAIDLDHRQRITIGLDGWPGSEEAGAGQKSNAHGLETNCPPFF